MADPAMFYLFIIITCFKPQSPQYKKLKNDTITSLTLAITDQDNDIITDGPEVTVVLHI